MVKCLPLAWFVFLLAACATPDSPTSTPGVVESTTVSTAQPPKERVKSQPLKHLAGRKLKAMPETPLDVRTQCRFRDVAGGDGQMDLQVSKSEVKRFFAEVSIPKQGVCRFDMQHFEQTGKLPHVVLTDGKDGCVVRMWAQEKEVTVAFNHCQTKCSGDAFSYLWPILVDTRNGRCS